MHSSQGYALLSNLPSTGRVAFNDTGYPNPNLNLSTNTNPNLNPNTKPNSNPNFNTKNLILTLKRNFKLNSNPNRQPT